MPMRTPTEYSEPCELLATRREHARRRLGTEKAPPAAVADHGAPERLSAPAMLLVADVASGGPA